MQKYIRAVLSKDRALIVLTIVMMLIAVATIIVIATGIFDPKPLGDLFKSFPLELQEIDAEDGSLTWLDQPVPAGDFSLRLTGAWLSGEQDIGYGLVIGDPESYLVIAVSPLGYLSVWIEASGNGAPTSEKLVSWRTWPHVGLAQEQNEIWIDVQDGAIAKVWINRELLNLDTAKIPGLDIGYWLRSYGEAATVKFDSLELYSDGDN